MSTQTASLFIRIYIPNALSFSRIATAILLAVFLTVPHSLWIAQVLILAGIISDKLDGTLARMWKVESDLGKRVESIADPVFVFFAALYAYVQLDYPALLFFGIFISGFFATSARILIGVAMQKMFYEKSQITRIATASGMISVFLYIFQIPYREWLVWPIFIWGVFAFLNYCRMMIVFVIRTRREQKSTSMS